MGDLWSEADTIVTIVISSRSVYDKTRDYVKCECLKVRGGSST